jgi:hypothetical protein
MHRGLKIVALSIGIAALSVLLVFGFAIWVFIPLLPAAIVYLVALYTIKRQTASPARQAESEHRKAA